MADNVDYTGVVWGDTPTAPETKPTEVKPMEASAPATAPEKDTSVDYTGVVWGDNPASSSDGIPEIIITAPRLNAPEPVAGAPKENALDFLKTTVQNIPGSAYNMGAGVLNAATHPIETAKTMGMAAGGGVQGVYNLVAPAIGLPKSELIDPTVANQIGQMFKDRYGSGENILHTLKTDPVGFVADASTVLTGGGSALGALGKIGELGEVGSALSKAGGVATKVGEAINPLAVPKQVTEAVGKIPGVSALAEVGKKVAAAPGNIAAEFVGRTSSAGAPALKEAFQIGKQGGDIQKIFSNAQMGKTGIEDTLNATDEFLKGRKLSMDEILKTYSGDMSIPDEALNNLKSLAITNPTSATFSDLIKPGMTRADLMDLENKVRTAADMVGKQIGENNPKYKALDELWANVQHTKDQVKSPELKAHLENQKKLRSAQEMATDIRKSIDSDVDRAIIDKKIDKLSKAVKDIPSIGDISPISAGLTGERTRNLLPEKYTGLGDIGALYALQQFVGPDIKHALATATMSSPLIMGSTANVLGRAARKSVQLSKYLGEQNVSLPAVRAFDATSFVNQYAPQEQPNALTQYMPQLPYAPRVEPKQ